MQSNESDYSGLFYSRDFALLAAAMLSVLMLLAGWVIYDTSKDFRSQNLSMLETEATKLDRSLILDFKQSSYLLESLGRQILHLGSENKDDIARLLRSFGTENSMFTLFSWINTNQQISITSSRGALPRGIDVADRDYVKKSLIEPWVAQIGRPIEGRISGKWIVPIALGIEDYTGNYIGSVLVSIDVETLTQKLRKSMQTNNVEMAMVTDTFITVLEASKKPNYLERLFPAQRFLNVNRKTNSMGAIIDRNDEIGLYQFSASYPYILILSTNLTEHWIDFSSLLWQRMIPVLLITLFLLLVLWIVRQRVLSPLHKLVEKVQGLIRGENFEASIVALDEIEHLDRQLVRINGYLQERRNVEREQRSKIAFMKQAKEAAELSNRVKIDFLHSMSHELRTPLNTIVGFAELMKNEVYGGIKNEKYTQYIDDIYECSNSVQGLVSDVLALAKAEAGLLELQEKPVEVEMVIGKCIRVLSDRLKFSKVTLENRVRDTLPRLLVDELRLKQIILNLLSNAISHTPKGGSIIIDARTGRDTKNERYFEIVVTDFGVKRRSPDIQQLPSISEEMDDKGRPHLKSREQLGRISNLGIPLTKALVAMHQATLTIENTPGKASLVIVRFPSERIVS